MFFLRILPDGVDYGDVVILKDIERTQSKILRMDDYALELGSHKPI